MTTKSKSKNRKVSTKTRKKLALNKETLRDLSAGGKTGAVRGGAANPYERTGLSCYQCFGTLA